MSKTRDDFIKKLAGQAGDTILKHVTIGEINKISSYIESQENPRDMLSIIIDHAESEHQNSAQEAQEVKGPKYKRELEPRSPQFDINQYKEAMAAPEILNIVATKVMRGVASQFSQIVKALQDQIERARQAARTALEPLKEAIEAVTGTNWQEIDELSPYIFEVIGGTRNEADEAFTMLLQQAKETGDNTQILEILEKARMAQNSDKEITDLVELEDIGKHLPRVIYNDSKELKTLTDKWPSLFFSLTAPPPFKEKIIDGQRNFTQVSYEKRGTKNEITLFYDYSFNEDIIKQFKLTPSFDDQAFFVASIIDNLLDEGNPTVSLTKIWHELGYKGSPNSDALTDLVNILRLGMSTIITADITHVYEAWNVDPERKGKTREIISPVIPVQIAHEKFEANGKTAAATINITGHTPFYLIGYPIDHYTTWDKSILRLYKGRRTKRYYNVLRFLITQIGWMRNGKSKRSNKISYDALYKHTGDKTSRACQLSRDMMYRLLDEVFIPTGYINAYKEESEHGELGVVLYFTKTPQLPKNK